MKIAGRGRILNESDLNLWVEEECAHALGLQKDAVLHGVVLTPRGERPPRFQEEPVQQWITIVASPFPTPSWGNLIRASFTIDPAPGSLRKIIVKLSSLGLFCRHIESTNGVDFKMLDFYGALNPASTGELSEYRDLIIPSTVIVLEVPPRLPPTREEDESFLYDAKAREILHKSMRAMINAVNPRAVMKVQAQLEAALNAGKGPRVTVDWISPMRTLNRLGKKTISTGSRKMTARDLREKLVVHRRDEGVGFGVSVHSWRKLLWFIDKRLPDSRAGKPAQKVLAISHADSDERVLVWNLFSSQDHFLAQFEVMVPADGAEQEWWRWIFERIEVAGGNIITASMSSRLDGHWSIFQLQVVFPIFGNKGEGVEGDVGSVLLCFRELTGEEGRTKSFERFKEKLRQVRHDIAEAIGRDPKAEHDTGTVFSSVLQNVVVWDPQYDQVAPDEHVRRFSKNPFSFTIPLGLDEYNYLYPEVNEKEKNRFRLARKIIDRISADPGENIAIVGAPRAGKTTLINLVYDQLRSEAKARNGATLRYDVVIPVKVNASVVAPVGLFLEIVDQVEKWARESQSGGEEAWKWLLDRVNTARQLLVKVSAVTFSIRNRLADVEAGSLGVKVDFRDKPKDFIQEYGGTSEAIRAMTWSMPSLSDTQAKDFLRSSLEILRGALARVEDKAPSVRLVVLVDEVSTLSAWGRDEAMPIWRHAIESKEFLQIRWLISTSRPLEVATNYSPITNVFKEYNVGSLRLEEARRLLLALSEPREGGKLTPVVTSHARVFIMEVTSRLPYLMQVCCYHLYERSIRSHVPLITTRICRKLVDEEVLPDIADYLEHQWRQIPSKVQDMVKDCLNGLASSYREFFQAYPIHLRHVDKFPPQYRKILRRSGLQGEDDFIVAPLVALWLLNAVGMNETPAEGV